MAFLIPQNEMIEITREDLLYFDIVDENGTSRVSSMFFYFYYFRALLKTVSMCQSLFENY